MDEWNTAGKLSRLPHVFCLPCTDISSLYSSRLGATASRIKRRNQPRKVKSSQIHSRWASCNLYGKRLTDADIHSKSALFTAANLFFLQPHGQRKSVDSCDWCFSLYLPLRDQNQQCTASPSTSFLPSLRHQAPSQCMFTGDVDLSEIGHKTKLNLVKGLSNVLKQLASVFFSQHYSGVKRPIFSRRWIWVVVTQTECLCGNDERWQFMADWCVFWTTVWGKISQTSMLPSLTYYYIYIIWSDLNISSAIPVIRYLIMLLKQVIYCETFPAISHTNSWWNIVVWNDLNQDVKKNIAPAHSFHIRCWRCVCFICAH